MRTLGLALAIVAAFPVVATAKDAPQLTRTEKWVVDYSPDACNLLAQFGTGDATILLKFTRYELGDGFALSVFGKQLGTSASPRTTAKIDFGLQGGPVEVGAIAGSNGKYRAYLFASTRLDGWRWKAEGDEAPPVTPAQEAAVTGVTIAIRGKKPLRLEFGPLDKPMAQLRACQNNLLKSWGYDPAVQASLQRAPRPISPPYKWLTSQDYPVASVMNGRNGMVQFRLDIDAEGKVGGCYVLDRTNPDEFADITCRAVSSRAKFEPALDAQGKAVRSYFVQKVQWQAGN
ncbi:energy transducer TonB [Sphingomonas sp. MMS12-HWE2-04]|uniref:energy transducer TonB n=1 Tax=Sphingomonas sp. MMS12-HWE2-04 TaxID=3234199 RepID=UPI00384BD148